MDIDPIELAETIRRSYAVDLIGRDHLTWKGLLRRYGKPEQSLEEKLDDLVRMRGPYLQVLGIPAWSASTWPEFARSLRAPLAPDGLTPELIQTFSELGFQRLYEFQEQAMAGVLADRDTLVVAGTGRGKTESWLMPLLHFIIAARRGEIAGTPPHGTKALLIYPTKALAQDQLRRLILYLMQLNSRLDVSSQVTVGIYDGDTPSRASTDKRSYLYQAFSQFRCPIYDSSQSKCQTCSQRLVVASPPRESERLVLTLPNPQCSDLVDLSFVHLTREDIEERLPDIVITNPDMLNLRLLDINDVERRKLFILQPRFVVLDEVHTYTELFGSFTGLILRRLRQQRRSLLGESASEFRVIAASATVANKEQLFSRLCGLPLDQLFVAQERTEPLAAPPPHTPPLALYSVGIAEHQIEAQAIRLAHGQSVDPVIGALFDLFALVRNDLPSDVSKVANSLSAVMFARLRTQAERTPGLHTIRSIHRMLSAQPMTPSELAGEIQRNYPSLNDQEIQCLIHNFLAIGTLSGIVEGRVHLFAWPVDGMYVCVGCGKVYDESRASCESCGAHFISKLVVCSVCGQEAVESWMCLRCMRVYPLSVLVDGEMVYYQRFTCSCDGEVGDAVRALWRPFYQCKSCSSYSQIQTTPVCRGCESRLIEERGSWRCSNIQCGRSYTLHELHQCARCSGELQLAGGSAAHCLKCGSEGLPLTCACGAPPQVTLRIPWVCRACGEPTWDAQPLRCNCGGKSFALAGLFDLFSGIQCRQCKATYVPGHSCDHTDHQREEAAIDFQEYKIIDSRWRIESPSKWTRVVPCYHRGARYQKGVRYESLMRSPANVAVTSAQYALRSLLRDADDSELAVRLSSTKLMAFSDSYSDMEELSRDFDEPEMETFIDQLIFAELAKGEQSLDSLSTAVIEGVKGYSNLIKDRLAGESYNWVEHYRGQAAIRDIVESRFLPGFYRFRWRYRPAFVTDGIANVRLARVPTRDDERRLLLAALQSNHGRLSQLREELREEIKDFDQVYELLSAQGYLQTDQRRERFAVQADLLVCTAVSRNCPIAWEPGRKRFRSNVDIQLGGTTEHIEQFDVSYVNRIDVHQEHFSRIAYRIALGRPLILRSAVYKGDVPKEQRRKIEDAFKNGTDLHFLSTGPAMEVGIDIGSLNMLLLLGTPPNINAYLQRVGRAGRRSKRALIFSVSKRNPIDFYYYRTPLDLIQSAAQPVPLNDHNEEVLRVSLSWALLDYIAANFWVTWREERTPEGSLYTDGEPTLSRDQPRPTEIVTYTRLIYRAKTPEVDYGGALQVLGGILERRADEARTYLEGVLDYAICPYCGSITAHPGRCLARGCQGETIMASARYTYIIDQVMAEFEQHLIMFADRTRMDLMRQRRGIEARRSDLEDAIETTPHRDTQRRRDLNAQIDQISGKIQSIQAVLGQLSELSFAEAQRRSSESRYAYQIRSVSPTVDILLYEESPRPTQVDPRTIEMALREYHPYAVTLRSRIRYLTAEVEEDIWLTNDLRERLGQTEIPYEHVYGCRYCGQIYEQLSGYSCPRCGRQCLEVRTVVIGRAHSYRDTFPLSVDPSDSRRRLRPTDAFRLSRSENPVDSTFALIDSRVCSFERQSVVEILRGGDSAGWIEFGDLELVNFTIGTMVTYQSGVGDPRPQLLVVCDDPACRYGITTSSGDHVCMLDANHDRRQQVILRPAYVLRTQGVRLRIDGEGRHVLHSLAHGLRAALEKIGGVLVRSIGELVLEEGIYLYDTTPGGAGVTSLLTRITGGDYTNFQTALEIMRAMLDCSCLDGCPQCLYQYGCHQRNSPRSLSRRSMQQWLSADISLRDSQVST